MGEIRKRAEERPLRADETWFAYDDGGGPVGRLIVIATPGEALRAIRFPGVPDPDPAARRPMPLIARQLDEYFAGGRTRFDLEIELSGTPLQLGVWERLRRIPYGSTVSYGQIAADLGEDAFPELEPHERARAVGTEVGRTPVPIVIPCHRVIGADGSLVGYGGGLDRKRALLGLESAQLALI